MPILKALLPQENTKSIPKLPRVSGKYTEKQYPEHNLVRTKAQFKLLQSAEEQTAAMKDFIASCI